MIDFSVQCVCVNDNNRPSQMPESKWVKKGSKYTIFYTVLCLPQKKVGVMLREIELTENEMPYEYFLLERFGFLSKEDVEKLNEIIKACTDEDFSISELMKQTELIES